jgi:predicted branched-subunit amino acid permease
LTRIAPERYSTERHSTEPRDTEPPGTEPRNARPRRGVLRNAIGVGVATGAYGVSFGALSVTAGLSTLQTMALSLLMFTGGSQFAVIGVLGAGGGWPTAAGSAALLGSRNAFYGLPVSEVLDRPRGWRRMLAAQFVIDEATAMALGQTGREAARFAFWATGVSVYLLWGLGTLAGTVGVTMLPDPKLLGLDAAAPAAFLALLAPRLRGREPWLVATVAVLIALLLVPVVPVGVPVLAAGLVAIVAGLIRQPVSRPGVPRHRRCWDGSE